MKRADTKQILRRAAVALLAIAICMPAGQVLADKDKKRSSSKGSSSSRSGQSSRSSGSSQRGQSSSSQRFQAKRPSGQTNRSGSLIRRPSSSSNVKSPTVSKGSGSSDSSRSGSNGKIQFGGSSSGKSSQQGKTQFSGSRTQNSGSGKTMYGKGTGSSTNLRPSDSRGKIQFGGSSSGSSSQHGKTQFSGSRTPHSGSGKLTFGKGSGSSSSQRPSGMLGGSSGKLQFGSSTLHNKPHYSGNPSHNSGKGKLTFGHTPGYHHSGTVTGSKPPIRSPGGLSPVATAPTRLPGDTPTRVPGDTPTRVPGDTPTRLPGDTPTRVPGDTPTRLPGDTPTRVPGDTPTRLPGDTPTRVPGDTPTRVPGIDLGGDVIRRPIPPGGYYPPGPPIHRPDWCYHRPTYCHWWYDVCAPIRTCQPHQCVVHTCYYVTSDCVLATGEIIEDARWWLGVKGTYLPQIGFGIDTIENGSPAAEVGLQPGMVITRVNDFEINGEDVLPRAIGESGGLLNVVVRQNADGPTGEASIMMQRVPVE